MTEKIEREQEKIDLLNERFAKGQKISTDKELMSAITWLKPGELNWNEKQQLEDFGKLLKDTKLIEALWVENIVDCEMTYELIIRIKNMWFSGDLNIEDIKEINHEKIIEMNKKYWRSKRHLE